METRCPFAEWRPLGAQSEPRIGVPRVLIAHTMVGTLRGTDGMFRRDGYSGTESTFGIGGDDDGALDGAIWQWQRLDRQADAQFDGNAYATSVETSDGGRPLTPWSPRQAEALIRLGVWWCQTTGNPARLVDSPSDHGIGYHAQFREWNLNGHSCPGSVRLAQLRTEIVPEIAHRLGQRPPAPSWTKEIIMNLPQLEHGSTGVPVKRLQGLLCAAGSRVAIDGDYGPLTESAVRTEQRQAGIADDGIAGRATWTALLGA